MTKNRRILHIAPTPFFADRGCHIRIEGIVRCLSKLGFESTVCTYHHGKDVEGVDTKRIATIKKYTQTEAGPNKYKLLADWRLLWLTVKHYRKLKPAAIHAHLHEGLMIGLLVKLMFFWRGTPLIGDLQGSLTGELDSHGTFRSLSPTRWFTRILERILMWGANHLVCSSPKCLDLIQSEFGVPDEKSSLAQDGADAAKALSENSRNKLIRKLSLPKDKTIVVYSGALLESKGLAELKEILLKSKTSHKLHFLIIGYPEENLMPFVQNNRLADSCSFAGQVSFKHLWAYLSLADIAIDPKQSEAGEGSGKMLNYIAGSLPVVAFDTQNNQDFLPVGTRLPTTTQELVKQLEELADGPELRAQIGRSNFAHFNKNYTWAITTKQLKDAYTIAFRSTPVNAID